MTNQMPPVHPGEILKDEIDALGWSANALAKAIGVPANRVSSIIGGRRAITADTALRLGRFFGTAPQFWLGLQQAYDLKTAEDEAGPGIAAAVTPLKELNLN